MKPLIIYTSKYGATRQYAGWLGDELGIGVTRAEEVKDTDIGNADFLIIGTPIYYGRFRIRNWLKKHVHTFSHKKLYFFVVGGTPPEEQDTIDKYIWDNIPEKISKQCEVHFLHGRIAHKNLTWIDRLMMKLAVLVLKDPAERQRMRSDFDAIKKENIKSIVLAINTYRMNKPNLTVRR